MEFAMSICYATAADNPNGVDLIQCGETIYDVEHNGNTLWSVRCPTDTPAEPVGPKGIDGATVGTIVVASLIGVALIGGAIAVHLEV
jgi:hypothetical protein